MIGCVVVCVRVRPRLLPRPCGACVGAGASGGAASCAVRGECGRGLRGKRALRGAGGGLRSLARPGPARRVPLGLPV